MKISKAKLVKGTFLEVLFNDGSAEVVKRYPNTEAPPKLIKAFMDNNRSQDEIQGKLFQTADENFIVKSEATATAMTARALDGEEVDVTDLYLGAVSLPDSEQPLTEQETQGSERQILVCQ